ncbi:nucleoporin [Cristinia sonorae]|uniref:Nucleoporin n=1 Tax=Cristinia sonorae TaxID=1940300 RepID=A0A8K0UM27_9AGAR|nr:nucleoporin [Cristinia sonorae]
MLHSAAGSSALVGTSTNVPLNQIQPPADHPSSVDLPALQAASRVLHEQYAKDAQVVPELLDMMTIPGIQSSATYNVFPDDYRVPFQRQKVTPIPVELFQHYSTTGLQTHMGILPQLERAWISIDSGLYLWDYIGGHELMSYTEQPDVITGATLVKPKAGVFIDEITSLLVLRSPISITLIGVSATPISGPNNQPRKDIKLYATDMSISTDVEMSSVIGTTDGRIFMCSIQDGNLYELHYQEKEGWFGKRIQLINHSIGGVQSLIPRLASSKAEDRIVLLSYDSWRNVFYALTANNSILVYKPNGEKVVQHLQTLSNLYKAAQDKAPGSPALTPKAFVIVSLHPIEPSRSPNGVQLMAFTQNASRLFFAPTMGYSYGGPTNTGRPLQLVHVRLPPPNLLHPDEQSPDPRNPRRVDPSGSRPFIVSGLEPVCYSAGLTVAAQPGDSDASDFFLCLSPDLPHIGSFQQPAHLSNMYAPSGQTRPPLVEKATLLTMPGRTWDLAVVPRPSVSAAADTPAECPAPVLINDLATQFSEPPRQFMILTNVGMTHLVKRRPLDALLDVVEEFRADNNNAHSLMQFRDSYGRDQTCAMLLALASGNTFLAPEKPVGLGRILSINPEAAAVAKQAFYDFGERPIWTERMTYGNAQSEAAGTATFSGRREGLALYLARLVRPIWKAKLTQPGPNGSQQPNIADEVLVTVQQNLFALKEMLDRNPQLFHSAPGDHPGARSAAASEQEAWKAEQNSVSQLLSLLARTVEALSFFMLLTDHHIDELIAQCEPDAQKMIAGLTFEQLVTDANGVQASRALVNVIINQQIGQQINVDTISEVLQQRCGSFCSTDDVMLYKARENVRKASETSSPIERQNWLGESLRLFAKAARILELEKLREICGDYQQLNYAKGAVELPLHCAQVVDADQQGRNYWHSGCPPNDNRSPFWQARLRCYDLILDSLSVFEERSANSKQPTGGFDDPEIVRTHAYDLVFSAEDEMFHSVLYDWLIQRGVADELLEMRPVFLEAHLRREPVSEEKLQLLWQFYVKDKQPLRAAEVLGALAETSDFDIPLESRLEYLTLAVGNAKSHPISTGGNHEEALAFLTDLEEKLDVAQVQLELYQALVHRMSDSEDDAAKIRLLTKGLYNVSQLFQVYADPYDLPVIKLLIIHVSEHQDDNLVRPIWNRIFEDAMEGVEPEVAADRIQSKVQSLGQRFYPSVSAFPLRHIASLLVRFMLANKGSVPHGWAPRILVQCGVAYADVWDILHDMYESQIPPFNDQANVQAVSSDIAVLLTDWVDAARRPQSGSARSEFPVFRIDTAVDQYLSELEPSRTETKASYEAVKRQLRRNW